MQNVFLAHLWSAADNLRDEYVVISAMFSEQLSASKHFPFVSLRKSVDSPIK
jgi:hypothetical protein